MKSTVITCDRCGRENHTSEPEPLTRDAWKQDLWVAVYPAAAIPVGIGPMYAHRLGVVPEPVHVCPGCLIEEERAQVELFHELCDELFTEEA